MKKLTIIVLGDKFNITGSEDVEILYSDGKNLIHDVIKAQGKYISFIKSEDKISDTYISKILNMTRTEFDCCYINYKVDYNYYAIMKTCLNEKVLSSNKPYAFSYIWNYVYMKEKLLVLLNRHYEKTFNKTVDNLFLRTKAITDVIYYHNPKSESYLKNTLLVDYKKTEYYKNIIYVGNYCSGVFNGYVSWLNNIGACFGKEYDITILYDSLMDVNFKRFSKHFNLVKYDNQVNYTCNRLLATFSTYYYPNNIYPLEANYLFIHANMSDYPDARRFNNYGEDIYTKYVAVSKTTALKAVGYFDTKNISYIYNPFKLDDSLVVPHLKLVSAQRSSGVKKLDRLSVIANILDEEGIPYTWNVFTDSDTGTNKKGLIYRDRVYNPLPFIKDSDYFVLLSDSEACPYSILEALSLNTKVVVTPIEVYDEIGVRDGENAIVIPFEYFDSENKENLREVVRKMYLEKDKTYNYEYDPSKYEDYKNIFKK